MSYRYFRKQVDVLIVVVGLEQHMGSSLEKLLQIAMIKQYFTWRRYFHSIFLEKFVSEGMLENVNFPQ